VGGVLRRGVVLAAVRGGGAGGGGAGGVPLEKRCASPKAFGRLRFLWRVSLGRLAPRFVLKSAGRAGMVVGVLGWEGGEVTVPPVAAEIRQAAVQSSRLVGLGLGGGLVQ
jgi:hypothetical protein